MSYSILMKVGQQYYSTLLYLRMTAFGAFVTSQKPLSQVLVLLNLEIESSRFHPFSHPRDRKRLWVRNWMSLSIRSSHLHETGLNPEPDGPHSHGTIEVPLTLGHRICRRRRSIGPRIHSRSGGIIFLERCLDGS